MIELVAYVINDCTLDIVPRRANATGTHFPL